MTNIQRAIITNIIRKVVKEELKPIIKDVEQLKRQCCKTDAVGIFINEEKAYGPLKKRN